MLLGFRRAVAEPSQRDLITWSEIAGAYQGHFRAPVSFEYSEGHTAQLSNGTFVLSGHISNQDAAVVALPGTLNGSQVTLLSSFADYTNDLLPAGWAGGDAYRLGGILEIGTRLYFTKHQWYNATGTNWQSFGYNSDISGGAANAVGLWSASGTDAHNQRVAGQMCYAPQFVLDDGYHFVCGQQGESGSATARWGPNLFAVQINEGGGPGGSWPTKPLIYHPDNARQYPGWWIGDKSAGTWIETDNRHGVLFIVSQQMGDVTWYGLGNAGPNGATDPYSQDQSFHATGYRVQAWLYDPAHLQEVYNGTRNAWSLEPYEKTDLISRPPGSSSETYHSVFTAGPARTSIRMSLRNGRLIIMQPGATPRGHVFNLSSIQ